MTWRELTWDGKRHLTSYGIKVSSQSFIRFNETTPLNEETKNTHEYCIGHNNVSGYIFGFGN